MSNKTNKKQLLARIYAKAILLISFEELKSPSEPDYPDWYLSTKDLRDQLEVLVAQYQEMYGEAVPPNPQENKIDSKTEQR